MSKKDIPLRGHYSEDSLVYRREWLQQKTQTQLNELIETGIDPETLRGNIESYIGTVKIPLGVAGPLKIDGGFVDGEIFAPFATSEGALLSSINRGAKAITMSGGVSCRFISQSMQRAPIFECRSMVEALALQQLFETYFNELQDKVSRYTNFGKLVTIDYFPMGKTLNCRFNYTTNNAAGQNMTTTVTNQLCYWVLDIAKKNSIEIKKFLIEANLSGDKKVNAYNFSQSRGCKVIAEAFIEERIIKRVLKTTSDDLVYAINQLRNGAISTNTIGFNVNTANVVAAIFTATGQDIACSHESSLSHLDIRKENNGVYCTLMMPSLIVGTVGGGTALPSQRQCLKIMGCTGDNSTYRFAEIICAFALALDLSTASAIASGQFAASHEKLGRNKPGIGFKDSDFNVDFFKKIFPELKNINQLDFDSSQSILAQLSSNELSKWCGFKRFNIEYESDFLQVVLKSKPSNNEVANVLEKMAFLCEMSLGQLFKKYKKYTVFSSCTSNEIQFYKKYNTLLKNHIPKLEYLINDSDKQRHLLIMEDISHYPMLNTVCEPELWDYNHIESVIRQLAGIHKIMNADPPDFVDRFVLEEQLESGAFYRALWSYHFSEFDIVADHKTWIKTVVDNYDNTIEKYSNLDMSAIHNDCNPRNICLNECGELILYDWELISIGHVLTDVLEFIVFMSKSVINSHNIEHLIQTYISSSPNDSLIFSWADIQTCLHFFVNQRLALYFMAHNFKDYQFLSRVLMNACTLNTIINEKMNESYTQ